MTEIAMPPTKAGFPMRRSWTYTEFENAWKQGIFCPEERLELIEGEIVEKMPQDSGHAAGIGACEEAIKRAFPSGCWVRIQMPLLISEGNAPEPDLAVVRGSWRDYRSGHPTTALLVIEVAETSLAYDRTTKAGLYARAGVTEYWILNLTHRLLEVYRQPAPASDQTPAPTYQSVVSYSPDQAVTPLAAPGQVLAIADLLP